MGISYLFIAHNLAVVEHFAHEVAVMYLGRIVETAASDALYSRPIHPYTHALLSAVPKPVPGGDAGRVRLTGEVPSPINPPSGCPFHPRCPLTRRLAAGLPAAQTTTIQSEGETIRVVLRCTKDYPALKPDAADPTHLHACLLQQKE